MRNGTRPLDLVSFLRPRFSNRLSPARVCLIFFFKKKSLFSFFPRVPPRTRTRQHPRKTPLELEKEATARPPKRACANNEAIRSASWHVSTGTYVHAARDKRDIEGAKTAMYLCRSGLGVPPPRVLTGCVVYFPLYTATTTNMGILNKGPVDLLASRHGKKPATRPASSLYVYRSTSTPYLMLHPFESPPCPVRHRVSFQAPLPNGGFPKANTQVISLSCIGATIHISLFAGRAGDRPGQNGRRPRLAGRVSHV